MKSKFFLIFILIFLTSCGGIEFVHKSDENPRSNIYNKVDYIFKGKEITANYKFASVYLGSNKFPEYKLTIHIDETKIKRAVETNQVASKLDYELLYTYSLTSLMNECLIYNKSIYSRFSHVPKSSGYNFGSEKSLDSMYELAAEDNLSQFISLISNTDLSICKNEN